MAARQFTIPRLLLDEPVAQYLKKRNGIYQLDLHANGRRIRKSMGTADRAEATALAERFIVLVAQSASRESWIEEIKSASGSKTHWLYKLHKSARDRARKNGREFSITYMDTVGIAIRSGGYCEVTGLALVPIKHCKHRANPIQPSLDRADSARGYVKGNVRMVCYAANLAMGVWGQDMLEKMAIATVVKLGSRHKIPSQYSQPTEVSRET